MLQALSSRSPIQEITCVRAHTLGMIQDVSGGLHNTLNGAWLTTIGTRMACHPFSVQLQSAICDPMPGTQEGLLVCERYAKPMRTPCEKDVMQCFASNLLMSNISFVLSLSLSQRCVRFLYLCAYTLPSMKVDRLNLCESHAISMRTSCKRM